MTDRIALWRDRDPALDATACCWPGCGGPLIEERNLPLCTIHFIKVGHVFVGEFQVRVFSAQSAKDDPAALVEQAARRAEQERARQAAAVVYYVRIHDVIKIGYTSNLRTRVSGLRVDPDAVLATEPGGRDLEAIRHREFAECRIGRREDFRPTERLLRHIDHVRETFGEPVVAYPQAV